MRSACFVSLSFAGLVVLARSLNPIPSRTRPLNSSAPMVLWLKPWESRSLPDLPRTKKFLVTCHDQTKRRFPSGRRRFCFCDRICPQQLVKLAALDGCSAHRPSPDLCWTESSARPGSVMPPTRGGISKSFARFAKQAINSSRFCFCHHLPPDSRSLLNPSRVASDPFKNQRRTPLRRPPCVRSPDLLSVP